MVRKPDSKNGQLLRPKGDKHRDVVLGKQLRRLGKVGGIKDCRLDLKDKRKTESEKSLHRHIVEKLRQMNDSGYDYNDDDDPMNKAAFGNSVGDKMKQFQLDEKADGGIQSDVVDEEFFGSGMGGSKFRDALSEKIALSKLEKLKRVEENEEQRDRVKSADSEWSNKIRFILSQVVPKGKKKSITLTNGKSRGNKLSVAKLLEDLSSARKVVPVDRSVVESEEKRVLKLQTLLETKDDSATSAQPNQADPVDPRKTMGYMLRLLFRMPQHEQCVKTFVTEQLSSAQLIILKDVVHYLLLAQLLIEHCEAKFRRVQSNPSLGMNQATRLGIYCPELVQIFTRLIDWMVSQGTQSLSSVAQNHIPSKVTMDDYKLDIRWADPSFKISADDEPKIRLACANRILQLACSLLRLYTVAFPSSVCTFLFDSMYNLLDRWAITAKLMYPIDIYECITQLSGNIRKCREAPTPPLMTSQTRLSFLSSNSNSDNKLLKQFGLLPQLEPRIDEKLDARHPKKLNTKRVLQRKIAKEKRGVMREIRRDGEYLTKQQLKATKANDLMRKKKTQAILTSMRAIED